MRRQPFASLVAVAGLLVVSRLTADTLVSGTISTSTTWTLANSPYVVTGDIKVQGSGSPVLTIQPGVTVKFNQNVNFFVGANAAGGLQAVGTSSQPITFTANGSTTAGYWRGIQLMSGTLSSGQIAYATVSYGGVSASSGGISITSCSPTISNVTAQSNANSGISVLSGAPTISNSTLSGNPWGLGIVGGTPTLSNVTVSGSTAGGIYLASPAVASLQTVTITGNTGYAISQDAATSLGTVSNVTATSNTNNAIELRGTTAGISATWQNIGLPYIVTGDIRIQGAASPTVTIQPGVTLKFNQNVNFFVGANAAGGLLAVGTSTQPITFTANGSTTAGYWKGIQLFSGSLSTSQLAYVTVSYGGVANSWGGIHVLRTITLLDHLTLTSNKYAGVSLNGCLTSVSNSGFSGNDAGLVNQTPANVVVARLNWWNAASGPSGSGPGSGQSISTGATYEPWLASAPSAPQWVNAFTLGNRTFNPTISITANFTATTTQSGSWTLKVYNSSSTLVRTLSGSGASISTSWDGKKDSGVAQPDGTYTYKLDSTAGGNGAATVEGFAILNSSQQLVVTGVTVTPAYFSPNGDGIQDTAVLSGTSNFDGAAWSVSVKNSSGTVVRTANGPAAPNISFTWDGKNGSGVTQPDGVYTLALAVTDGSAQSNFTPTATLDLTLPVASISAPTSGATVSDVYQSGSYAVNVSGTGTDLNFASWAVDFGVGSSPTTWISVGTGNTQVSGAQFTTWATNSLANGTYTLRLTVADLAGNRKVVSEPLTVGNFTVTGGSQSLNLSSSGTATFTSTVPFTLTETLTIQNSLGQTVRTLFNGQRLAGTFNDVWDGKNSSGALVPDGPYFAVAAAVAGTSSMTWNPGSVVTDSTPQVYSQINGWGVAPFYPFNNSPLAVTYTCNGGAPRPGRAFLLFTPDYGSVEFQGDAKPSFCSRPGNFCMPNGEFQAPGTHTLYWEGADPSGVLRTDITAMVLMVTGESATGNTIVTYGTSPTVTNLLLAPTYFRPGAGQLKVTLNAATSFGRTVGAAATFQRLGAPGPVQTVTLPLQSAGPLTLNWDGRSSNGLLVAPGAYLVTTTVTDSSGSQTTRQSLITVNY